MNYKELILRNVFGKSVKLNVESSGANKTITTIEGPVPPPGESVAPHCQATLSPDSYHVFTNILTGLEITVPVDEETAVSYVGRFTTPLDVTNFQFVISPDSIIIPDEQRDKLGSLEANHTYEFNIYANVFMISDITDTSNE